MNYNQNNNNLFEFMFNSACNWSGLKQSDIAFSDKSFTGEFIYMLKKDINFVKLWNPLWHPPPYQKKKEQSAKIPGMEVVNKDLKW